MVLGTPWHPKVLTGTPGSVFLVSVGHWLCALWQWVLQLPSVFFWEGAVWEAPSARAGSELSLWCRFSHFPSGALLKDSLISVIIISTYFYCIFICLLSDNIPLIFLQPATSLPSLDYNNIKLKQCLSTLGYFSLYQLNFLFSLSPRLLPGELLALNDISLAGRLFSAFLPMEWWLQLLRKGSWSLSGAGCVQGAGGRCWAWGFHGSPMGLQCLVCTSGAPQSFLHSQCHSRVFSGADGGCCRSGWMSAQPLLTGVAEPNSWTGENKAVFSGLDLPFHYLCLAEGCLAWSSISPEL